MQTATDPRLEILFSREEKQQWEREPWDRIVIKRKLDKEIVERSANGTIKITRIRQYKIEKGLMPGDPLEPVNELMMKVLSKNLCRKAPYPTSRPRSWNRAASTDSTE